MQKQPFPVGGGSKKFEDWGGLKNFRTDGRRVLLLKESVPHYVLWLFQISHNCLAGKFLLKLI